MADPERIRVLVADDHNILREGLISILKAFGQIEVVAEASSGTQAVQRCAIYHPDVVLMDVWMPDMDGIEATRQITTNYPDIKVIALTSYKDKEHVTTMLEAGAIGYLVKDVSTSALVQAIMDAYADQPTLSPDATRALIERAKQPASMFTELTERESEVLGLMIEGLTNPDIAERLMVSRHTVRTHVSNILSKLGASTRVEAVSIALQNKLITPPGGQ